MVRALPLLLIGCGKGGESSSAGDDSGTIEGEAACIESAMELGIDDQAGGMGAVSGLLEGLKVSASEIGAYADGVTTNVFIETRFEGDTVIFVQSEQNPTYSLEIDMGCTDRVEAVMDAELITADDQLRVFREFTGRVDASGMYWVAEPFSATDNTGGHDAGSGNYRVSFVIDGGGTEGDVTVTSEGSDSNGVWIENTVLLAWPVAI
jgi:hypothetical protein